MEMTPEQALSVLRTAAQQSKLTYQDHVAVERSVAILANALGITEKEPEEEAAADGEVQ